MFTRVAVVMVLVMGLLAQRAEACSCKSDYGPQPDVMTQLHEAKEAASAVFYARVVSIKTNASGKYTTTLDVLEAFKGTAKGRVKMPSGDNAGDCSFSFENGGRYLIYAWVERTGWFKTGHCSRSRRLENVDDGELKWLRTGVSLPVPVALQREVVECNRCDATATAIELTGVKERSPNTEADFASASPFWSHDTRRGEVSGREKDGRLFQLVQAPVTLSRSCRQSVTLKRCTSFTLSERDGITCVEPTRPKTICDEDTTRKTTLLPTESMRVVKRCDWREVDNARCELETERQPVDGGLPVLRCAPAVWGTESAGDYACGVGPLQ